jgi:hypothetical protein
VRSDQALTLMALVVASFPTGKWPEGTQRIWLGELDRLDAESARDAARELFRHTTRSQPTFADFLRHYEAEREARLIRERARMPALPSGEEPASRNFAREAVAYCRVQLTQLTGPLARALEDSMGAGRTRPTPSPPKRYTWPCVRCGAGTTNLVQFCDSCLAVAHARTESEPTDRASGDSDRDASEDPDGYVADLDPDRLDDLLAKVDLEDSPALASDDLDRLATEGDEP